MSSSSLSTSAVPSTSAHIKSFLHGRAGKAIACTTTTTSNSIVTSTTAIGNESSPIAVFTNSSHTPAIDISETCANGDNANLIQPFSSRGRFKYVHVHLCYMAMAHYSVLILLIIVNLVFFCYCFVFDFWFCFCLFGCWHLLLFLLYHIMLYAGTFSTHVPDQKCVAMSKN